MESIHMHLSSYVRQRWNHAAKKEAEEGGRTRIVCRFDMFSFPSAPGRWMDNPLIRERKHISPSTIPSDYVTFASIILALFWCSTVSSNGFSSHPVHHSFVWPAADRTCQVIVVVISGVQSKKIKGNGKSSGCLSWLLDHLKVSHEDRSGII